MMIEQIETCESCIRNRHTINWTDKGSEAAAAYLLVSAAESARDPKPLAEELEQSAVDFVHNISSYADEFKPSAGGAVGFCGRQIGKGACEMWMYDQNSQSIVEINQTTKEE